MDQDSVSEEKGVSVSSNCSVSSRNKELREKLQRDTWVQCENPNCLKWRRIPKIVAKTLTEKDQWFCFMSSDPQHNQCSHAEEDYVLFERLANRCGLKYTLSELPCGALVWAKMVGYCRWPAIIVRDPEYEDHVYYSQLTGEPQSYHVEYLGEPHSRGWVSSRCVELYGHADREEEGNVLTKKKARARKHGKGSRNKKVSMPIIHPKRQMYKKHDVSCAVTEADELINTSLQQRLQRCNLTAAISQKLEQKNADKNLKVQSKSIEEPSNPQKEVKVQLKTLSRKVTNSGNENLGKSRQYACTSTASRHINNEISQRDATKLETNNNNTHHRIDKKKRTDCANLSIENNTITTANLNPPYETSHSQPSLPSLSSSGQPEMEFSTSMMNRTKEEKFTLDLQMYRRNEKAFEHDVRRFMVRNGLKITRLPLWKGNAVSLFQLFSAVYDRGGFKKVARHAGGWSGVYKEFTGLSQGGHVAKMYYKRNLLPYELYLAGKKYKKKIKKLHEPKKMAKKVKSTEEVKNTRHSTQEISLKRARPSSDHSCDIEEMLAELESFHNQCTFFNTSVPPAQSPALNRLGLNVTFHDQSPVQQQYVDLAADTASEFAPARLPSEHANDQHEDDNGINTCAYDTPSQKQFADDDSQSDQILHEMEALQQEINELDFNMSVGW